MKFESLEVNFKTSAAKLELERSVTNVKQNSPPLAQNLNIFILKISVVSLNSKHRQHGVRDDPEETYKCLQIRVGAFV